MADEEKVLDPTFHFPPGVRSIRYKGPEDDDDWNDSDELDESDEAPDEFSGPDIDEDGEDEDDENGRPYPPDSFEIVSQTVRTLKGGGQVVDVTIEFPDLTSGSQYDLRLTKG